MQPHQNSITGAFFAVVKRDFVAAIRNLNELLHPVLFFFITVSLFPLAVTPDPIFLQQIAPGIIWVSALLSTLLALDSLFKSEFDDGTLEILALSPHPLAILTMAKVLAHWLTTGLPLIIVAMVLGVMLNLPYHAYAATLISLLLGTPALSIIGAIGAALTVGLKRSGVLLALIIMPLYIPILIFGTSAIQAAILQLSWSGQVYLLAAILILCLTLAPFAIATAIKISLN